MYIEGTSPFWGRGYARRGRGGSQAARSHARAVEGSDCKGRAALTAVLAMGAHFPGPEGYIGPDASALPDRPRLPVARRAPAVHAAGRRGVGRRAAGWCGRPGPHRVALDRRLRPDPSGGLRVPSLSVRAAHGGATGRLPDSGLCPVHPGRGRPRPAARGAARAAPRLARSSHALLIHGAAIPAATATFVHNLSATTPQGGLARATQGTRRTPMRVDHWRSAVQALALSTILAASVRPLAATAKSAVLTAPPRTISGRVTDVDGHPIAHATARVIELKRSAITGDDGEFTIQQAPPGTYSISYAVFCL